MADLTVIWWRDIPVQVVAKQGRTSAKVPLSPRFQEAIDMAATRDRLDRHRRVPQRMATGDARVRRRSRRRGLEGSARVGDRRTAIPGWNRWCDRAAPTKGRDRDRHRRVLGHEGGRDRVGAALRHHRRAHQSHRTQEARRGDEGGRLLHGDRRHREPGRGRCPHAGRERRDPARRRTRDPGRDGEAGAVAHRRAALDRLLDRGRARGRPGGLRGQAVGELRDRGGRAHRAGVAAGGEVRGRRRRDHERRDRHQRRPRRAVRGGARRSCAPLPITASPPPTSWSTRW